MQVRRKLISEMTVTGDGLPARSEYFRAQTDAGAADPLAAGGLSEDPGHFLLPHSSAGL